MLRLFFGEPFHHERPGSQALQLTVHGAPGDTDPCRSTEKNDAVVAQAARQVRRRRRNGIEYIRRDLPITQPIAAAFGTEQGRFATNVATEPIGLLYILLRGCLPSFLPSGDGYVFMMLRSWTNDGIDAVSAPSCLPQSLGRAQPGRFRVIFKRCKHQPQSLPERLQETASRTTPTCNRVITTYSRC